MNDLNGLEWSTKPVNGQKPANYNATFSSLRPIVPTPGRTSPLSSSASPKPQPKSAASANDSFSNLVSFSSSSANKNLSLLEQQKQLEDQKRKLAGGTVQNQLVVGDDSFWNNLGSGRSTPNLQTGTPKAVENDEDDFLAAFNAPKVIPNTKPAKNPLPDASGPLLEDDDDPFGLSEFQAKQKVTRIPEVTDDDDDDVLGLLGQPVIERAAPARQQTPETDSSSAHPQDKAVAELVDMGFPPEKAQQALETTDSGTDVQAAVGWLLNQAHSEAQSRSRARNDSPHNTERPSRSRSTREEQVIPHREQRSGTPSNDPAKVASELGANFLKTAGSLWKVGQKKVQQAVQELNSDSDSSQPKWMRETRAEPKQRQPNEAGEDRRRRRSPPGKQASSVTDEALMLEGSRPEKPTRQNHRSRQNMGFDSSADTSRDQSPAVPSRLRESHTPQPVAHTRPPPSIPAKSALTRQAAEEQAATAYVSSARRKKPAQSTTSATVIGSSLLEPTSTPVPSSRTVAAHSVPRPAKSTPAVVRPAAPARPIPSVSSIALKACHADREAGNEHFKRGDYSSAHQSYTRALSHIPTTHPVAIVLLTNRALTALKTGEPRVAVSDSDKTIEFIGPSKGESETVDLGNGDSPKPMRDYYGKALMRKAEALEQMEKWAEAAVVWKEAVEGGHGGATSIQARMRAEKAANPQAVKPKPTARKPATRPTKSPATSRVGAAAEAAAVSRLRQQNAAAEKADDEKFALTDAVDARIAAWKGRKADNLRALLGSLDTVLWPEAGWKKISMADLVLPNKVKIQYMKGIAKVHPDKIPTNATIEQRMIAGSVFSALNEAWDKFRKENGL